MVCHPCTSAVCASDPSPRLAGQPRGVRRFLRVWACLPLFAGYLPYYLCVGVSVVILWWLGDGDACGARVNDATWGHDDLEPRRHQRPRRDDFTPASTICATRSLVARFDSICGGNEGNLRWNRRWNWTPFPGGRWEGRGGAGSGNTPRQSGADLVNSCKVRNEPVILFLCPQFRKGD